MLGSVGGHKIKITSGISKMNTAIEEELTNLCCKGPGDKYFRLCGPTGKQRVLIIVTYIRKKIPNETPEIVRTTIFFLFMNEHGIWRREGNMSLTSGPKLAFPFIKGTARVHL